MIHGLYAITPDGVAEPQLLAHCTGVLRGGARVLQYRDKQAQPARRESVAHALRALCQAWNACLIINDDPALARRVGADGVHLGRDDGALREIRAAYPELLIGASCYDSLERAATACADGADYLAFGAMAASPTKPLAVRAPLSLLGEARRFGLPLVAIGGIHPGNAAAIHAAGADALAMISALFEHPSPEAMARVMASIFAEHRNPP